MKTPSKRRLILGFIVFALIGYLGWLGFVELRAEEPRRAVVSLEMIFSGDWLVPHLNSLPYYNKPPLFNWIVAIFYLIFDSYDEWVVRLPSLLSLFLMGWFSYAWGKKYLGKEAGILAGIFLLSSADVMLFGGVYTGEIDFFYSLLVFIQVFAIFHFFEKKNLLALYTFSYAFAALGFLTKGLPSIPFQGFTLLAMALTARSWKWLFNWQHALGLFIFLGINTAYFYPYSQAADLEGFLIRQFDEAASKSGLVTSASDTLIQLFTFPFQFLKLIFPWSFLVIFIFKKKLIHHIRASRFITFACLFILLNIPIYWVSGLFKARYVYMFLPFALLILSHFFLLFKSEMTGRVKFINGLFYFIGAAIVLGFLSPPFIEQTKDIELVWLKSILGFILGIGMLFLLAKSQHKFIVFALLMILLKFGNNLFYLPAFQNDQHATPYRDYCAEIVEITGKEPIYFKQWFHRLKTEAKIGPWRISEKTLIISPFLGHQIPYYLDRAKGVPMEVVEDYIPGALHLLYEGNMTKKDTLVYSYYDYHLKQTMVVVRH